MTRTWGAEGSNEFPILCSFSHGSCKQSFAKREAVVNAAEFTGICCTRTYAHTCGIQVIKMTGIFLVEHTVHEAALSQITSLTLGSVLPTLPGISIPGSHTEVLYSPYHLTTLSGGAGDWTWEHLQANLYLWATAHALFFYNYQENIAGNLPSAVRLQPWYCSAEMVQTRIPTSVQLPKIRIASLVYHRKALIFIIPRNELHRSLENSTLSCSTSDISQDRRNCTCVRMLTMGIY